MRLLGGMRELFYLIQTTDISQEMSKALNYRVNQTKHDHRIKWY